MKPTQARLRELFDLLPEGLLFWRNPPTPRAHLRGLLAGSPRPNDFGKVYWTVTVDGHQYTRGQLVFVMTHGIWPTPQLDHINGDSFNDAPENLRVATASQNAWNRKHYTKSSPLPMGVRRSRSGHYLARIGVDGRAITIGSFETVDAAAAAYQQARKTHFGEFA